MQRKTALVVSGIITTFVMVLVIGLFQISGRFSSAAQAASLTAADAQVALNGAGQDGTDVATLQAEVIAYRAQLQQAYAALQQAYDEIQVLSGGGGNGLRGFRGRGLGREQAPGSNQPFDQQLPSLGQGFSDD